jgi:hypothetical protein
MHTKKSVFHNSEKMCPHHHTKSNVKEREKTEIVPSTGINVTMA